MIGKPVGDADIGNMNVTTRIASVAARTRIAFGIAALRPNSAWNVGEDSADAAVFATV
jgi:hypothetical protein